MEQGFNLGDNSIKSATVLGAGRSGLAAAKALVSQGVNVFLSDEKEPSDEAKTTLNALKIDFETNGHTQRALKSDLLVISPGMPWHHPFLKVARKCEKPLWGELELGFRLCPSRRIIAVTGTNGKSTTTQLIGALLQAQDHDVVIGGNLGMPFCELLNEITPDTWVVLEVSSFQLESASAFYPYIGVWLNLTPDHLDRHGNMDHYRALKQRLFQHQTADDHAVLGPAVALPESYAGNIHRIDPQTALLSDIAEHQRYNLSAALTAAQIADPQCSVENIDWKSIFNQPHCLEYVDTINGTNFYNDSKATNPDATIAALESFQQQGPLCVLLGGEPKGTDPTALARYIASHRHIAQIILFGPFAEYWKDALNQVGVTEVGSAAHLDDALTLLKPNIRICLLSPAGSSFDLFANYMARGEAFKQAVKALKKQQETKTL